ncbi:DNA primase family protein [Bacillus coahuilensis]|uniref:DNA primase family protein n=1 Tax=Bacillus coahuilensis TaxID=408580 RepID=UPI00018512FB|nr:phage/plasmid primase, P4 family [Bacillus coahuilensis]
MAKDLKEKNIIEPNFDEIDGKKNEEEVRGFTPEEIEEQNKKVEEFETKHLIKVSEKDKKKMKVWETVLKDEKGNEFIGPINHTVAFDGNEKVKFIPPFLQCTVDNKGNEREWISKGFLAEYLIENINAIYSGGLMYIYDNGVYRPILENEEKGIIKALLTPQFSNMNTVSDVASQWKIDYRINKHPQEINSNNNMINLKNGLLDISDNENWKFIKGHNPEHLSTIQIQANYNPEAKGKEFHKFLDSSVPDKQVQVLLQEMVGYCLTPFVTSKQMIFILTGQGDSGKSTFLNATLEALVGDNAKSHVALQDLDGNEYNQAELFGKIVNIFADLPDKPLKDIGYLKAATGKDWITARRIRQAPFQFKNKAKFVYSANDLPSNFSKDSTDAFYNRLTLIPFNQKITKKDPYLEQKLEKEIDYIAYWALQGLQRLISNGFKFSENQKSNELKAEYKKNSNPVMVFVEEYCELSSENETPRVSLWTAWQNFCEQNGHVAGSQIKFNKNLTALYGEQIQQSQMNNSRRTKSWKGIRPLEFDEIG